MPSADGNRLDVRRFRPGDGERVRELNAEAMAAAPEWVPDAPDRDLQNVTDRYLAAEGHEFLVGTVAGTIVATGAYASPAAWKDEYLDVDDETAELTRVRVDPAWQRRGFGRTLYRELRRRARSEGYRRFVLDTGAENDAARGFYEALGFACVRELTVEYDGVTLELALYRRCIVA